MRGLEFVGFGIACVALGACAPTPEESLAKLWKNTQFAPHAGGPAKSGHGTPVALRDRSGTGVSTSGTGLRQ